MAPVDEEKLDHSVRRITAVRSFQPKLFHVENRRRSHSAASDPAKGWQFERQWIYLAGMPIGPRTATQIKVAFGALLALIAFTVANWDKFSKDKNVRETLEAWGWWGLAVQIAIWGGICVALYLAVLLLAAGYQHLFTRSNLRFEQSASAPPAEGGATPQLEKGVPDATDEDEDSFFGRPAIEQRILLHLLHRAATRDELRIHFDGIHDQLIVHHTDTLEEAGFIQKVPPPKTGRSFERWELARRGRKYLVERGLMPKANMPPAPGLESFQRRILNVLSLEACDTEEIARRAIIPPPKVEGQLTELQGNSLVRRNKKTWSITEKGEKRLRLDDVS